VTHPIRHLSSWPRLMRADTAARYVDGRSVRAFRRGVGTLYPFPIKVKGKGARWFRDDLDHALVRLKGQTSRIFDALSIHSKVCRRMVDYDHRERRRGANEWTGYCCCEKATSCENPPIKPMKLPSGIDHVQSLEVHINNNINPYLAAISRP
jgi:hypothetical protein